jgi:small-conductance mechanosensitive channel
LNFAIDQKLREAGIEMAFPQRDIHIKSGVLKVEAKGFERAREPESGQPS